MNESAENKWEEFLHQIATPRPNHGPTLSKIANLLKQTLVSRNIPVSVHRFKLRPFKHLLVGCTLLLLAVLYAVLLNLDFQLLSALVALAAPTLLILEFEVPISPVSGLITKTGENIIASFKTPAATSELLLCAHYDSKTDLFDHTQRQRLYDLFIPMITAGIAVPLLLKLALVFFKPLPLYVSIAGNVWTGVYLLFWFLVALAFGGFVFIRQDYQSKGVIDNATAVSVLMALATSIQEKKVNPGSTDLTFLFTSGEEVSMQGAHAYVRDHFKKSAAEKKLPCYLLNLELVGQTGEIMAWRKNGVFLRFLEADPDLMHRFKAAVKKVTGKTAIIRQSSSDDAFYFQVAGIPALTIGHSGQPLLENKGFHSKQDDFERYSSENLQTMLKVLKVFVEDFTSFN